MILMYFLGTTSGRFSKQILKFDLAHNWFMDIFSLCTNEVVIEVARKCIFWWGSWVIFFLTFPSDV